MEALFAFCSEVLSVRVVVHGVDSGLQDTVTSLAAAGDGSSSSCERGMGMFFRFHPSQCIQRCVLSVRLAPEECALEAPLALAVCQDAWEHFVRHLSWRTSRGNPGRGNTLQGRPTRDGKNKVNLSMLRLLCL